LPEGVNYDLHVSIEATVSMALFPPEPVHEIANNDEFDRAALDCGYFFTFFDPNIGNGGEIHSSSLRSHRGGRWHVDLLLPITPDMLTSTPTSDDVSPTNSEEDPASFTELDLIPNGPSKPAMSGHSGALPQLQLQLGKRRSPRSAVCPSLLAILQRRLRYSASEVRIDSSIKSTS
jgi:hypothetical protein